MRWAVDCFRLAIAPVRDDTQMHTHMCYSEFGDFGEHIARLDADVLSIEASRSGMDVPDYANDIGPGVYDIHSPRVPSAEEIERLLERAEAQVGRERLWVNPDCGLKTRRWEEALPALENMMEAVRVGPARGSAQLRRTEQIPAIAGDVGEHRDAAVRFRARLADELDSGGPHPLVGRVEVLDAQEQPDAARELAADRRGLFLAVGARQQDAGPRARAAGPRPSASGARRSSATASPPRARTRARRRRSRSPSRSRRR